MTGIDRPRLLRRALWLSSASVALSGLLGCVAAYFALATGALSMLGFGVDAVIDAAASVTLIWRFRMERQEPTRAARVERLAERVISVALLVLAAYLFQGSARALVAHAHPEQSVPGTVILIVSVLVLPAIARAKLVVARDLSSPALRLDGILTAVAALLALISLVGLGLEATFGLWWADAVAALIVSAILVREGVVGVRSSPPG